MRKVMSKKRVRHKDSKKKKYDRCEIELITNETPDASWPRYTCEVIHQPAEKPETLDEGLDMDARCYYYIWVPTEDGYERIKIRYRC